MKQTRIPCPSEAWDNYYRNCEEYAQAEENAGALLRMLAPHFGLSPHATHKQIISAVETWLYKCTDCGASAFFPPQQPGVVLLNSIVEGTDYMPQTHRLEYPFAMDKFWSALKNIEEEALEIWNATHGCEDCWQGQTVTNQWGEDAAPDDQGWRPVDPNCPECKGQGCIC